MDNRINRIEFLDQVAEEKNLNPMVVKEVYQAIIDGLSDVVLKGNKLSLTGFGSFYLQKHKGHPVSLLSNGKEDLDTLDDYLVLKFSPSNAFIKRLRHHGNHLLETL